MAFIAFAISINIPYGTVLTFLFAWLIFHSQAKRVPSINRKSNKQARSAFWRMTAWDFFQYFFSINLPKIQTLVLLTNCTENAKNKTHKKYFPFVWRPRPWKRMLCTFSCWCEYNFYWTWKKLHFLFGHAACWSCRSHHNNTHFKNINLVRHCLWVRYSS